jgi:dihydroorotase
MPNTRPLTITQEALDDKLRRAADKCLVNYGFFIGATLENLPDLLNAQPVCGIKIFMGSMHGRYWLKRSGAGANFCQRDAPDSGSRGRPSPD